MRVLCTGDIHIGRCSAGVPADRYRCRAADAWDRIVGLAIERRAGLVVLAGDVVDEGAAFYEAYGALERGVATLRAAGVPVVAIAGNHDFDTLPRIAGRLDGIELLGRGGKWECTTVDAPGEPELTVIGWSFPGARCRALPLADRPTASGGGCVLGVVHGTLDGASADPYAPIGLSDLAGASGVDAWVVGHTHVPAYHSTAAGAAVVSPGSPQPLDFGEPGAHGPWLLDITPGRAVGIEQVANSTAAYLEVRADVTGAGTQDSLAVCVQKAVVSAVDALPAPPPSHGRCHRVRVTLTGRTHDLRELEKQCQLMVSRADWVGEDILVDALSMDVAPEYDLEQLAQGTHAAGRLARLLLDLECDGDAGEVAALLRKAEAARSEEYVKYPGVTAGDQPDLRAILRCEARRLLDAALAQKGSAPGPQGRS